MRILSILPLLVLVSSLQTVADEVSLEDAFQHIVTLTEYSPRVTGSQTASDEVIGGSYSAALYIAGTLEKYEYDVEIDEFDVTTFQITEFTLIVDFDGDFSTSDQLNLSQRAIPPTMQYMDISYDVTAPLAYVDEPDITGKILVFDYWDYYDPRFADIVGHSTINLVYKENEPAFAGHLRESFSISYDDYLTIREKKTAETLVRVKFSSHSEKVKGFNVTGIKGGGSKKVILTAHYDSVFTDGAIDNGSGVAALLETARILSDKDVEATLYFVFLDAEELGLLGSEAFIASHEELKTSVCINVDSIASGDTLYIGGGPRYTDMWGSSYSTNADLDSYVTALAAPLLGYTPTPWFLEDVGGYSDFVSFTEASVPATDITAMDKEASKIPTISENKLTEHSTMWLRGGRAVYYNEDRFSKVVPYIHTIFDDASHVDEDTFFEGTRVVAEAAYQLSRVRAGEVAPAHIFVIGLTAIIMGILWYVHTHKIILKVSKKRE